jgi:outer membrane protein assembly factor BamB
MTKKNSTQRFFLLAALLLTTVVCQLLVTTQVQAAKEWTQWRGAQRNGILANAQWLDSLDTNHLNVQWSTPLGPSYSGPVIQDGIVYTTETRDQKWEVATAFEVVTGKKLWETKWDGAMSVPFFARSNGSWIRATPTLHRGKLYVAGMRDMLVCLDAKTGKKLWSRDFPRELKTAVPSFGFVSSPLPVGEALFVQAGGGIMKIESDTGKTIWTSLKDGGGMNGSAFSSPTIETLFNQEQLVVQKRTELVGLDLEKGKVLWNEKTPAFRGMNIMTPCKYKNGFFASTYGGGSFFLNLSREQEGYQVEQAWKTTVQGYMSTPILIDKYAYLHLRNQRVTCIDMETGKQMWTTRPYGKYWSMVSDGKRILALDSGGTLYLLNANPDKFDLVDSRKVSDSSTWAHLATIDGYVFIRSLDKLISLRWAKTSDSP